MYTSAIEKTLAVAFAKYPVPVAPVLSPPNKNGGGDFQCNSVLQLAGRMRMKPGDLAREIADAMDLAGIAEVTVTGPGYLNFILADGYVETLARASAAAQSMVDPVATPETVVIDFGGPNIAKALHVGHLRSFVIGESLRRILKAVGHEVVSDIHYGDWGLPIGKLILGIETSVISTVEAGGVPNVDWSLDQLGEFYRLGNELTKSDPVFYEKAKDNTLRLQAGDRDLRALWSRVRAISLAGIEGHIKLLGAHFDTLDGESDVDPLIPAMIAALQEAGLATESDGALVGQVVEDDSLPPVLLRKSDGSSLYGTTDLATIVDRIAKYEPDRVVYCVDGRQGVHLKTCFMLAEKAAAIGVSGFTPLPHLVHADFGTVNDASGKPYSTREGKPALLEDLIDEALEKARDVVTDDIDGETARKVAIAALKFADLSTDRRSGYVFDPERMMSFTGRTGPYLQYACARVSSLLRKAADDGRGGPGDIAISHPADRDLAVEVLGFPAAVHRAAIELQPKAVCDAAYDIATALSRLYAEVEILRAPDGEREGRLALLTWAGATISTALDLLGIEVPERM
ncbi:arginine--tRNA ligase [Rhizobium laguerreae]|uniref:arginine--tRNA ligase n=1 Tax=Rhizobium laguerreae TaxID=1076926 RepID=UPI001C910733|nr:arginine--tRNA ligase [Rhizobium laguerreae]MBY3150927.1 arginine--tRNA ligase [Rhizobium laguerreae]